MSEDEIRSAFGPIVGGPKATDAAIEFLAWLAQRGGSLVVTPSAGPDGFAVSLTVRFGKESARDG